MLVIHRVRVLRSGPHIPTQFFWEYPRVSGFGRSYVNVFEIPLSLYGHISFDTSRGTYYETVSVLLS